VTWSDDERHHLASCEACAAEWRLVQAAGSLGAGLRMPDPAALAGTVLARVRAADAGARRKRQVVRLGGLVGLAAAAALAVSVLVRQQPQSEPGGVSPVAFDLPLAELEGASDDELRAVLAEFEPPISEGQSVGEEFDGMDATEVERALSAWEES
jgi:hypothetical protein